MAKASKDRSVEADVSISGFLSLDRNQRLSFTVMHTVTMRLTKACLVLLISAHCSSALVAPSSSVSTKQQFSSVTARSTRLQADATAVEVPRGGESGGTATIPTEVFNLIKSIVGAGVLSLPAGR
jgi:hypothetical protein